MSVRSRLPESLSAPVEFVPKSPTPDTREPWRPPADTALFLFGVVFPAVVVAVEAGSRMCARTFFDPIPTAAHMALVASVPALNLLALLYLRPGARPAPAWMPAAIGLAIGISSLYALLFLPLFPVAMVAVLFYGIGLLPMGPLAAFLTALRLRKRLAAASSASGFSRKVWLGIALGLSALVVLDVPQAATRLGLQWAASGDAAKRERGLTLLRTLGDRDLLLRLCSDVNGRPAGLLSLALTAGGAAFGGQSVRLAQSPEDVREVFYRVYGVPFNAVAAPEDKADPDRFGDFAFDPDHGGTEAGARMRGLDLVASRLDGSLDGDDAIAYLEWTFEFRNTSLLDREARVDLMLPPGAVVSRASLWIDGEERDAAWSTRETARRAYTEVAVRQRRDPLLVTTKGADRVLAQAFPVPRGGGTLKFKLGITAPLALVAADEARLTLPAIADRNFGLSGSAKHAVWIESRRPLATALPGLADKAVTPWKHRIDGEIDDRTLARTRPSITVARNPAARVVEVATEDGVVRQTLGEAPPTATGPLVMVVDGSRSLEAHAAEIVRALDRIPAGRRVGFVLGTEPPVEVPVAAWSGEQAARVKRVLGAAAFAAGEDNTPALVAAAKALEAEPGGELLWVHGPQPVRFRATASLLEQTTRRLERLPAATLYAVEPGPNELWPDLPWAASARMLPAHGDVATDLGDMLAGRAGPGLVATRTLEAARSHAEAGSMHVARLWAADHVGSLLRAGAEANRGEATSVATRFHLVTPVSGAVVLETSEQYARYGLQPTGSATVPAVPEPHEWVLIALASLTLLSMAWRQRHRFEAAR